MHSKEYKISKDELKLRYDPLHVKRTLGNKCGIYVTQVAYKA